MENVWRCLFASFKGIIQSRGDNTYSHHTGARGKRRTTAAADRHDRNFPKRQILSAEKVRDEMVVQLATPDIESRQASDLSSDESD